MWVNYNHLEWELQFDSNWTTINSGIFPSLFYTCNFLNKLVDTCFFPFSQQNQ